MKPHGINPSPERPLYSEFVSTFAALEQVSFPSAHTVLLIVVDAHDVSTETVARVAGRFLAAGLIYVCVWGPDCKRVHDIFDEVYVGDGTTTPGSDMMSTWHDDEPLEEAIWFFLECAFPLDHKIGTTSFVAVTVGRADWAFTVEHALSDLPTFLARMVDDEADNDGTA